MPMKVVKSMRSVSLRLPRHPWRLAIALGLLASLSGCAELDVLRQRNLQQEKEIETLRAENQEFQQAYYDIKATLDTELTQSEQKSLQLERELEQARNLRTQHEKELADELRTAQLEHQAFESEAKENQATANARIRELEQALNEANASVTATKNQLNAVTQQLNEVRKQNETLTQAQADLTVQLNASNERAASLEAQLASLNEQGTQHEAAQRELQEKLTLEQETREALEAERDEMQAKLTAAQAALEEQATNSEATEQLKAEQSKTLEALKQAHAAELATLNERLSALEGQLTRAKMPLSDDAQLQAYAKSLGDWAGSQETLAGITVALEADGLHVILPTEKLFGETSGVLLSEQGTAILASLGGSLKELSDRAVRIEGHTDDQPIVDLPFPDNWALGFARADGVRDWLMSNNILPAEALIPISRANQAPREGHPARRVEIVIGAKR